MESKTLSKINGKTKSFKNAAILIGIIILIYAIFKVLRPDNFGQPLSLFSYFQQALMPTVAACGFYFIIVMGLFDFSIGANIVLSAIIGVMLSEQFGYFGLIAGCILVGTLIGLINGVIYVKLKIPSIIVTVGLMIIYECIGALIAAGKVLNLPTEVSAFSGAPWNIVLALIAFGIAIIYLNYTKIGTYTNAIGSNEIVSRNMGINVEKYKVIAFMLCGFFAGMMSILTISYGSAMTASVNMLSMGRSFTPIMGCFFALAFKRSLNPVVSMLIGEFIIAMIFNGLISLGVPSTLQNVVIGVTLITIIVLTTRVKKGTVVK